MPVQQEIKSQLAKLLATEDITVEHKQVQTASFNVDSRVLILPLWEKASNDVYDMLVGHEVGHALFTPNEWDWLDEGIPAGVVNVVEDARIEKLMKRKYMGIAKSFFKGYTELHQDNFFEINVDKVDQMNLADRANLYFKIGSFLDLTFTSEEQEIIDLIKNCETFKDTLSAAKALHLFCKEEIQKQKEALESQEGGEDEISPNELSESTKGSGNSISDDSDDNQFTTPSPDDNSDVESGDSDGTGTYGMDPSDDSIDDEVVVETVDALESKLQDLVDADSVPNEYVEVPEVNLDTIIASTQTVHDLIDKSFKEQQEKRDLDLEGRGTVLPELAALSPKNLFEVVDKEFFKFKKSAQKEVNYLVKEFECKKAASAYARASTSRTGVLDTTKLHTYKFSEDIFKKITVLPDGKNHGLVFVLDWSGSMNHIIQDTLKQLFNLIWFCKKVQIPFEVYAFTNEFRGRLGNEDYTNYSYRDRSVDSHYEVKENLLVVEDQFCLMNFFSSKSNVKELEHHMINIWRIASCMTRNCYYNYDVRYYVPYALNLSGTPLNESLISLYKILPKFQKDNGVEKVQCVILTDGEAHGVPYHKKYDRQFEEGIYMGSRNVSAFSTFLRDRKVGKTYKFGHHWYDFANVLLRNLKDRFPSTNFIGIRLINNREARNFIRMHEGENEKLFAEWKKNKSCVIRSSGYDAYFAMSASNLADDAEFEVAENATKGQIKNAFVKSLKIKKLNKKVLGEFISLVA